MPNTREQGITSKIPLKEEREEFQRLVAALDATIPAKVLDRNLLIATWNLREFGSVTKKWRSSPTDSPRRDFYSVRCIAEIISRFDVIAVQEVQDNIRALRYVLKVLQEPWSFTLTDVTRGERGNQERMAFLFDTRRVKLSGLACELVVPEEQLAEIRPDALRRQFARTPYAVSFHSAGKTFILVSLHVIWGRKREERRPELRAIARWLAGWAKRMYEWDHNLVALGDFNIDRKDDDLYEAFISTGLTVPRDLHDVPRSIFARLKKPLKKHYDQIAWFTEDNSIPALSLRYVRGGHFDFTDAVLKCRHLTKQQLSYHISDHYPLWVEFSARD